MNLYYYKGEIPYVQSTLQLTYGLKWQIHTPRAPENLQFYKREKNERRERERDGKIHGN